MKKLILLLLSASAITTATFAQDPSQSTAPRRVRYAQNESRSILRFGLKAGANFSHLKVTDNYGAQSSKNSFGPGFFGGGLMEISGPPGSKLKGQVEALFNLHNFRNNYASTGFATKHKTSLSQISIPVMAKYFVIPSLSINAGLSLNFNIAGKDKYEEVVSGVTRNLETDYKERNMLQTVQVGALVGATYYIYKGFFVDARYNYYFGSMLKKMTPDYRFATSAIQVGIGYKF